MGKLIVILAISSTELALESHAEDLCRVLARPQNFAGKMLTIRAFVKPTMHGTYLKQPGCSDSLFLVLPEEIPKYRGAVRTVKDARFDGFLKARFDSRPDAPTFEATFSGQLDYSKRAQFGYYKSHRTRFVVTGVGAETSNE